MSTGLSAISMAVLRAVASSDTGFTCQELEEKTGAKNLKSSTSNLLRYGYLKVLRTCPRPGGGSAINVYGISQDGLERLKNAKVASSKPKVASVAKPVPRTSSPPASVEFKEPTVSITSATKITIHKSHGYEVYRPEPYLTRNYVPRAMRWGLD